MKQRVEHQQRARRIPRRAVWHRWARRIVLAGLLAMGVGYLPYRIYGPNGITHCWHLERDLKKIQDQNEQLREENRAMLEEINSLKEDKSTVERVARDELGLVAPDDVIFQVEQ